MLYTINDCLTGETMCTYAQLYIMSITVYVSGKAWRAVHYQELMEDVEARTRTVVTVRGIIQLILVTCQQKKIKTINLYFHVFCE